jgi:putative sterol carrier protein
VVRRRKLAPPAGSSVYELTEWGMELEPIVTRLGAWGARSPFPPDSQAIGAGSIVLALRSLFDPEVAGDLEASYELRLGEERFDVQIAGGKVELSRAGAEDAAVDGSIEADPATLAGLLTGQLQLDEAIATGAVMVEGSRRAIARFLRLFPMPEPRPAAADLPLAAGAPA